MGGQGFHRAASPHGPFNVPLLLAAGRRGREGGLGRTAASRGRPAAGERRGVRAAGERALVFLFLRVL